MFPFQPPDLLTNHYKQQLLMEFVKAHADAKRKSDLELGQQMLELMKSPSFNSWVTGMIANNNNDSFVRAMKNNHSKYGFEDFKCMNQ